MDPDPDQEDIFTGLLIFLTKEFQKNFFLILSLCLILMNRGIFQKSLFIIEFFLLTVFC